jgi:DNA-binding SARP family transcriptional activator
VEVQVLGALVVTVDGSAVAVRGAKERAVLSLLALRAGSMVSTGELIDALWGSSPPPSALRGLRNYVTNLRRVLPAGVVITVPDGYLADLAPEAVDALRFERAVASARGAADVRSTAALLGEALGWWRGPPLPDLAGSSVGGAEATRLAELRAAAMEDLYQARLALGEHAALVADLEAAVAAEPLRERRWVQLMVALYRSGRQADALRAVQRLRGILADELGLEPSAEVRSLEAAILAHDARLSLGIPERELEQPVDIGRPTANGTFLFAGIDGRMASRHLGPDGRAQVLVDHRSTIESVLAAHHATELARQGDGIFAVFSSPGECVRAVIDMRDALQNHGWPGGELIQARIGIHVGDVFESSAGRLGVRPLAKLTINDQKARPERRR